MYKFIINTSLQIPPYTQKNFVRVQSRIVSVVELALNHDLATQPLSFALNIVVEDSPPLVAAPPFAMFINDSKQIAEPTSCDISTLTGMTIDVVKAILDPIGVQYECTCYPASMSNDSLLSVNNGGIPSCSPWIRNWGETKTALIITFSALDWHPGDKAQKLCHSCLAAVD
ncbi:hypothetical protein ACTXT7_016028 [Hymenolepis weldensis]